MARKGSRRRQAVRDRDARAVPAWVWLTFGLVLGMGLAVLLTVTGIMPQPPRPDLPRPVPTAPAADERAEIGAQTAEEWRPSYDFYTVLPEMEVVIPEAEMSARVARRGEEAADPDVYLIQVGSFREFSDAEGMKARLALLGVVAQVRSVEIDGSTWHRVRAGPFESLRETDRTKRQLQAAGYDVIVLSERS